LKGYWSLPGGVLEVGETLQDGIRREVLEETGLEVAPVEIAEVFERIMRDEAGRAEYHYVLVDFICRPKRGSLRPGDDVSRAEWVRREDLERYRLTEGTLDVIHRTYDKVQRRSARVSRAEAGVGPLRRQ
jgi:ADP-ribose pyrophosphatase YjhB (NUDIX family)